MDILGRSIPIKQRQSRNQNTLETRIYNQDASIYDKSKKTNIGNLALGLGLLVLATSVIKFGVNWTLNLIGFSYNFYRSIREVSNHKSTSHCLAFWVFFNFFLILDHFIEYIHYWVPYFFPLKFIFLVWWILPRSSEKDKYLQLTERLQSKVHNLQTREIIIGQALERESSEKDKYLQIVKRLQSELNDLQTRETTIGQALERERDSHRKTQSSLDHLKHLKTCQICYNNEVRHALVPCGHTFCKYCIGSLRTRKCPICQSNFSNSIKFYLNW